MLPKIGIESYSVAPKEFTNFWHRGRFLDFTLFLIKITVFMVYSTLNYGAYTFSFTAEGVCVRD
ncbi:hypothetical protein A2881_03645 [Candidatus Peribacteria bacterium RIFCSPHIGHO2_01_FULL_55_13]|nr:MAG: hypothetical protein A2881_03645 [Candidatus Peribacteria bacterium RIFCSPHIGHO2_01_FULL_55_13]